MPNNISSLRVPARGAVAATGNAPAVWIRALVSGPQLRVGAIRQRLTRYLAARRAIAELDGMDERMLRDIGLEGRQVPRTVRFGLPGVGRMMW